MIQESVLCFGLNQEKGYHSTPASVNAPKKFPGRSEPITYLNTKIKLGEIC